MEASLSQAGGQEYRIGHYRCRSQELLLALYSTPQNSVMQLSQMQTAALQDITAKTGN
jgi:hypothetical protein